MAELGELEAVLGHRFARRELLVRALTHRSLAHELATLGAAIFEPASSQVEHAIPETGDNERLEFLGDAVLGLMVAEALFHAHPEWHEGELTRVRSELVSRKHMAEVAVAIDLGLHLRLSKGEERGGLRYKATVLSNTIEAVIGAMFLDGGLAPVQVFVRERVIGAAGDQLAQELRSGAALGNFKSALQEYLQSTRTGTPEYKVKSESGPDHRKRFVVEVRLKPEVGQAGQNLSGQNLSGQNLSGHKQFGFGLARGKGTTKKLAEQDAARRALELLKSNAMGIETLGALAASEAAEPAVEEAEETPTE